MNPVLSSESKTILLLSNILQFKLKPSENL